LNFERLTRLISELESDLSFVEPLRLQRRVEILERLEAYLLPLAIAPMKLSCEEAKIVDRLTAIQATLESINAEIYADMRREIRNGGGRIALLRRLPGLCRPLELDRDGYDYLDDLIAGVLQFEEPEAITVQPTAEMVFYQPTPARHIFDLLERTALTENDLVVDIGSGLGHVPILASIWTKAHSVGIEVEASYVACARRVVESLNLERIRFIEKDAREVDFESGTVFYLYTPFTGALLQSTLGSLRREANTRAIRICAFGPCTHVIATEDWLDAVGEIRPDRVSIFRSRVPSGIGAH
jgi:hypothetical protein